MNGDSNEGTITVTLVKRKKGGLGFLASNASPYLAVSHVVKGGEANETGFIEKGDIILEVNGKSLESVPYLKALEILDTSPTGETMVLKVRARDGFQACLETAVDKEGVVKTVRRTKTNGHPDNESTTRSESSGVQKCPITHTHSAYQRPKYIRLQNVMDKSYTTDTLHQKASQPMHCSDGRCLGSIMYPYGGFPKRPYGVPREPEEVKVHAEDFFQQYYGSMKLQESPAHQQRLAEVMKEIEKNGTYDLTEKELIFGCKMAWRNAPRCIGRIQWNKLHVFDARDVNTPSEMFEALCKHIKYATNKGNLRSTITVFPQRKTSHKDFRVWNPQLVRYAGYRQPDGSVIGDRGNVEFTEMCEQLGWEGKGGRFDVLPLVLQAHGGDPEFFEIPPEIVLEVEMKHPKYPWFEELGLRWYALPAVSCLMLDVGGIEFPGCPFNGWYMITEIGARDFGDPGRYDLLEPVAKMMGLDTKSYASLWKDFAMVEMNLAVLYSFQEAGVTISDHHTASESYLKHFENEVKLRGGCPGDWVWIVPPMSGSATGVFHQMTAVVAAEFGLDIERGLEVGEYHKIPVGEMTTKIYFEMLNYTLKPSYEYQDDPWKHYKLKNGKSDDATKKKSFKEVAKAVKFSAKLMSQAMAKRQKAVILYATETGKSERYAKMLGELFSHAFDPKVICMEEYSHPEMENEQLVLIVTSTFGNGDPPENGEGFGRYLYELRHPAQDGSQSTRRSRKVSLSSLLVQKERERRVNVKNDGQPLANLRYSVFGLGSRAYPNFCAFARSLDKIMRELGGESVLKMGEGDELCGQEESFKAWAKDVFKAACDTFCIGDEITKEASQSLDTVPSGWVPGRFRLTKSAAPTDGRKQLVQGLSQICGKSVRSATLTSVKNLQSADSSRSTILVQLKTDKNTDFQYKPGDHVAIFPANRPELVQALINRLSDDVDPDLPLSIEVLREVKGIDGTSQKWEPFSRLPSPITVREALSRYLDITNVPSPQLIKFLATMAADKEDKEQLEIIGEGNNRYEDWKFENECNILDVLQEYPSLRVPADLLLTQLPLLQPRFYSISSSPDVFPGEVHLTVAVVQFYKKGGKGPLHHGVCSTWLNGLEPGDEVPCYVRQAHTFHMPEDSTVPVIMVGPGTGIAPFRSFWQQRQFDITNNAAVLDVTPNPSPAPGGNLLNLSTRKWGSMLLFFGCRNAKQDYIYEDEMAKAKDEGALTEIHLALSREPQQPKKYVQDMLQEKAYDICEKLLSHRAHFYVCGDVKMADGVCKTLQSLLQEYAAMSHQEAQETVDKLKSTGRYHEDIFGVTLKTREVTTRVRSAAKRSMVYLKHPVITNE